MSTAAVVDQIIAIATVETLGGGVAAVAERQTAVATVAAEQGIAGPPGVGSAQVYDRPTPAATWIIQHNLGRRPIVAVYDAAGAEMIADVLADTTNVSVIFAQPTAGSAVLF